MSKHLPTRDFHEIEFTKKIERILLKTSSRTPNIHKCGNLIRCYIEYPPKVHEKTIYFPFLSGKKKQLK